jgi:hypothetical protein
VKVNSSLEFNDNNFQQLKLACYVGPISPKSANEIYEKIRTPSKMRQSPQNRNILRSDEIKGFERITRKYTNELNLPWSEYWSFLDGYYNLTSQIGLEKLEAYLRQKEFSTILNAQKITADNIINDKLNNNEDKSFKQDWIIDIIYKLNEFKTIVILILKDLEIKENILSSKFEQFIKLNINIDKDIFDDREKVSNTYANNMDFNHIRRSINKYLEIILEISKIDNICYFHFYKCSKKIFNIINYHSDYSDYFLSLINKAKKNENREKNIDLFRKLKYDISDDEDCDKKVSNHQILKNEKSIIDELESKFTTLSINDNKETDKNQTISKNHLKISEKINSAFKKKVPTENPIFIIGAHPSKIDKSVFFCLENCQVSERLYPYIFKWFNYIKNVENNEMQQWKTPQKNNFKLNLKNL